MPRHLSMKQLLADIRGCYECLLISDGIAIDTMPESAFDNNDDNNNERDAIMDDDYVSICPVCGSPIDYCQGHGKIGDPNGALILRLHDRDDHSHCHPDSDCRQ
jgi:hypothetical protein